MKGTTARAVMRANRSEASTSPSPPTQEHRSGRLCNAMDHQLPASITRASTTEWLDHFTMRARHLRLAGNPHRRGIMPHPTVADVLERCAADLHAVAFVYREPRRSMADAERLIAEVERIATAARAAVRGRCPQ